MSRKVPAAGVCPVSFVPAASDLRLTIHAAALLESYSVSGAHGARIFRKANNVSGSCQRAGRLLWVKGSQPTAVTMFELASFLISSVVVCDPE